MKSNQLRLNPVVNIYDKWYERIYDLLKPKAKKSGNSKDPCSEPLLIKPGEVVRAVPDHTGICASIFKL